MEIAYKIRNFFSNYRWLIPVIVVILLLPFVILGAFLQIWRTTPPDFKPVIRVSLVSYVQSKSLARSAEQHVKKSQWEDAERSWTMAIGINPGETDFLRKALHLFGQNGVTPLSGQKSTVLGNWLLKLTSTNQTDLTLVLESLERNRRYGAIGKLVDKEMDKLNSAGRAVYLRSLFHSTQYNQFSTLWDKHEGEFEDDPLMQIYHLGVRCILEGKLEDYNAFARARAALDPHRPDFHRSLQIALRAHGKSGQEPVCRGILSDLVSRKKATLLDHLCYWQVLITNATTDSIADYYQNSAPPATEIEAMILLQTLYRAGLKEDAARAAQKAVDALGREASGNLYLTFGNLLAANQEWQQLDDLAQDIDEKSFLKKQIGSDAVYWEALTALSLEKKDKASLAFDQIVDNPPNHPKRRFSLALKLLLLGQTQAADDLIKGLDGKKENVQFYWTMRIENTARSGDSDALEAIAKVAYESNPEYLPHLNNYLVALILQRNQPELALEIADQLIAAAPDPIAFQLNYIHALCLNAMWDKASELLKGIQIETIQNPIVQKDYTLAQFRLAVGREENDEILRLGDALHLNYFMPQTVAWVKETIERVKAEQ